MNRRIDVRPSMLRRRVAIRGVEVTLRRRAMMLLFQHKLVRGWPINRRSGKIVRQVDPSSARKRRNLSTTNQNQRIEQYHRNKPKSERFHAASLGEKPSPNNPLLTILMPSPGPF